MAGSRLVVLVCCLLASLSFGHGRPIPKRQILTKTVTSQPAKHLEGDTTQAPEERPTCLDDCTQYCTQSYPEHTYPTPSHHKACVTGCYSARVDALIAWPFKSSSDMCVSACSEAYPGASEQQFACRTGCNVTTIDSIFPDREAIYREVSNASETTFVGQATDLMDFFFEMVFHGFSVGPRVAKLTEHANQMSQLLPPMSSSLITYVEDDGNIIEYREYSFQGGVMIEDPTKTTFEFVEFPIADSDIVQIESSNADPPPVKGSNDLSGSLDSVYVYYRPNAQERYRWFTRSLVAKRVLLGISVVLIGLGLLMCCLSVLRKDSDRANGRKKKLQTFIQSHTPSTVKMPLDRSSEYRPDHAHMMVPVHIKVGGTKVVEGVMSVVT